MRVFDMYWLESICMGWDEKYHELYHVKVKGIMPVSITPRYNWWS